MLSDVCFNALTLQIIQSMNILKRLHLNQFLLPFSKLRPFHEYELPLCSCNDQLIKLFKVLHSITQESFQNIFFLKSPKTLAQFQMRPLLLDIIWGHS